MKRLEGKTAVITGGSDGIGLGIAKCFAEDGANLILLGRSEEKLKIAQEALGGYGVKAYAIEADLAQSKTIKGLCERILALHLKIDILVNNAGLGKFVPFEATDEALLDAHLNLNVKAPYLLTQGLLGALAASKGCVINISSYFANRMLVGRTTTAYSITKGALNSFTKSLAFEVGKLGIRVNAIAPGSVLTPQFERNLSALSPQGREAFEQMVQNIYPLGKIGSAQDIGEAAVFLASDAAKWVSGAIFAIDGGFTTN